MQTRISVLEVYDRLMTRIGQLKKHRKAYEDKDTPLDTMEAAAISNILSELYEVAKNLENTAEVNPPSRSVV